MSDPAQFYSRTRDARKIIVVDLGFLGDTVHLLPALRELKSNYPRAELHVLTSPVGAEVLRLAPWLDRAWSIEMYRERRTLREQWQVVRALRAERFDAAFNFSGADRTVYMTALTGARWRVAQRGSRWHFYNRWLIATWIHRHDPQLIVYEQKRRLLEACGLKLGPPRFELQVDPPSLQWAAGLVPEFSVHVSPNSAKVTREWPLEHHAAMFRAVWASFPSLRFLASGGSQERERNRLEQLAGAVKDERLQILPPGLSIAQLAAVLVRCKLHFGPDSGVLHLAVALGVPTVSLFREQGAYKSFMPSGARHRVISMPCHCVDGRRAPCEKLGRAECFEQISPGQVAMLLHEQLSEAWVSDSKP